MDRIFHSWDVTPEEARRIQDSLQNKISLKNSFKKIKTVGGADVAFSKITNKIKGAIVVCSFPSLEKIDEGEAEDNCNFPYIPGLLTFREGPVLLKAFLKLKQLPDVLFFDGQGIAHPRRMGIATHLGLVLNLPTVGCAKTPLFGEHDDPDKEKGSRTYLKNKEEVLGVVLRTRTNVKPVFVSPGHNIDLETSVRVVLACTTNFRIPTPLRAAHSLSRRGLK